MGAPSLVRPVYAMKARNPSCSRFSPNWTKMLQRRHGRPPRCDSCRPADAASEVIRWSARTARILIVPPVAYDHCTPPGGTPSLSSQAATC